MLRQQGLKGCLACAAHGRYRIVLMTRQGIKGSNIDLDGVQPVLVARQEPVSTGSCAPVSKLHGWPQVIQPGIPGNAIRQHE